MKMAKARIALLREDPSLFAKPAMHMTMSSARVTTQILETSASSKAARRFLQFRMAGACNLWTSAIPLALAFVMLGCSSPTPNYGIGNGLRGSPPTAAGVQIADASVIPPGILDASCDAAPTCSVSWSTDIFPSMESTGPWQCASHTCHGGSQAPAIKDGDPSGAYASLAVYKGTYSNPYIVPCNTDPTSCSIICNLTANGCGSTMPTGSGAPLTPTDLATLQTWVQCGSPLN